MVEIPGRKRDALRAAALAPRHSHRARGKRLVAIEVRGGGVLLRGESGAAPRRLLLEFDGVGESTRARMRFVQQREGWHLYTFPLNITRDNGDLVIRGVESATLPSGLYACRLVIDDLTIENRGRFRIDLAPGGTARATLDAMEDQRQVRLTRGVDDLPSGIRRLLTAANSTVDGIPVLHWLDSMTPRASRKACLLNVLAKLSAMREPLLDTVDRIFFADVDRTYAEVTPRCAELLRELAADPTKPFYSEGTPKSATHRRLLTHAGVWPDDYELESYRQEGRYSLQAVVAVPKHDPHLRHYAEFDIDLGNPLQDVKGFIVHLGEVASPGRTDHFALREKLKATCEDFLCYDIVEPHVTSRVLQA